MILDKDNLKLSVIIPCYNEFNTLESIIESVRNCGIKNTEIIIVDDFSTDGTRELLQSELGSKVERVLYHKKNMGKGAALRNGFQAATGDLVVVQDADSEYDPKDYNILIEPFTTGRVTFIGDDEAVCRANIGLRTAERILIKIGNFKAETFEELYQGTKAIEWEEWIPSDGKFWVAKAASVKSALFSPSDIQSIMKKAMVDRMSGIYGIKTFPETGKSFPLRVFIHKDEVTIGLDTTGDSLHKRGYRKLTAKAPIAENLASAIIMLSPWNKNRILVDPFCGSGTFPIEAAMMAANMAPGMNRHFTAETWEHIVGKNVWKDAFDEAREMVDLSVECDIQGYDLDNDMVSIARANAKLAGVDGMIHFQKRDVKDLSHPKKYGFIITNPPYGERLSSKEEMGELYTLIGERYRALDNWSMYMITAFDMAEKYIGRKADKNRKIYNGMMKTYLYQYMGGKPPKRD